LDLKISALRVKSSISGGQIRNMKLVHWNKKCIESLKFLDFSADCSIAQHVTNDLSTVLENLSSFS